MAESPRFLIVRLGSLGDIVHTLPASAALRDSFPYARLDWVVESRWTPILDGNPDLNHVIPLDRSSTAGVLHTVEGLRNAHYTCALEFQSLYKSALLARAAGPKEVLGFDWNYAREAPASLLYSRRIHPSGAHKVDHNLALAEAAGAEAVAPRFNLPKSDEADEWVSEQLRQHSLTDFYVISPGGGWRSKCWPSERFGQLHRELAKRYGWRGVVSFGPGEDTIANEVIEAAGDPAPISFAMDLPQLIALLRCAKCVIAADTGPLHLAAALGTPVVGLYGPTDPARNGPYGTRNVVVRNALLEETTYKRGASHSPAMLRIEVADVVTAVGQLVENS
ncbi:MAG: glycosyltransferase family 9 protein [Candidatus Acidiferrales bacterium]